MSAERIFRAALAGRRSMALLRDLVRTAPCRPAGSAGAAAAVEWARGAMLDSGLENVRREPVLVPVWERGEAEVLRFAAPAAAAPEPLPVLALGGSVSTPPGGIEAPVLVVSGFEELSARGAEARGRIVLFDVPMDPAEAETFVAYSAAVAYRARGATEAAKVGAVAAVVRSVTAALDDAPHTGVMRYEDGVPAIPAVAVSTLGAERIRRRVDAGEDVRLHLRTACRTLPDAWSANVVGEVTGTVRPEEILVVGGHLDAWDVGEGAHDDGAGCVQSVEALALLNRLGLRPRRTLRVVLFMDEESAQRGGHAYAADHAAELDRHVMALEADRGGFAPRGFAVEANPGALAVVRDLAAALAPWGADRVAEGGAGADVAPMGPAGVPLVGYVPDTSRYFDVHHAPTDVIGAVNGRELELGTAAMAALLHAVAERDAPLPRTA